MAFISYIKLQSALRKHNDNDKDNGKSIYKAKVLYFWYRNCKTCVLVVCYHIIWNKEEHVTSNSYWSQCCMLILHGQMLLSQTAHIHAPWWVTAHENFSHRHIMHNPCVCSDCTLCKPCFSNFLFVCRYHEQETNMYH